MRDETLLYYERELTYLREMGAQFALFGLSEFPPPA